MARTDDSPNSPSEGPRELGGYALGARLGSGATGVVYRGRKPESNTTFAVKVLASELANGPALAKRFEREARILRKLDHPGIVRIEDFGLEGNAGAFIVMELLEGETLEQHLKRSPLTGEAAVSIMRQVLEALVHAHREGVVHRDLKPANIFLVAAPNEATPRVRVLDFGLAKFLSHDETDPEGTLTRKGRVVGTPAYMAPEQITGVGVDARADLYAAGVILYELLADQRPFPHRKRADLMRAHLFEPPGALPERVAKDRKVEAAVMKALQKDPERRFQSAKDFLRALEGIVESADSPEREGERSDDGVSCVLIEPAERTQAETLPWHRSSWVTALVWVVSLLVFGAAAGTLIYAGVAVR
ncbi:MAG: serine/threonine-protein kinase [Myxococcota bacterium]